ncbi:MAG: glycosyltransferase, partial [Anaerolineales bacterium]
AGRNGNMKHCFVAINGGGAAESAIRALGLQVECLHKRASIPSLPALLALYRFFRAVRPAVVHTHGAEANFHGLLAAWLAGVPVRIGEEIGIPQHSNWARAIFRQVYRTSKRVIGISDSVTRWLVSSGEVPSEKVVRIYNPVRLPSDLPMHRGKRNGFRIGFVGRLESVKNPIVLIEACAKLVMAGIPAELSIVGDGSQRNQLESRVEELKMKHLVHIHGYQIDPIPFMLECNIYVQPSISEGFGLALVEAMGCGLPVIASSVGGAPEIIIDGRNGWLIHEVTSDDVFRSLELAYKCGSDRLIELGTAARNSVSERFTPSAYILQLEDLYLKHS